MGQYTEGQRLHGSDGNIYVVRNGVPMREAAPMQGAKAPYEAPQAAATLQRTQQEVQQANATAAATTAKTKAEADAAQSQAALLRQKVDEASAEKALETMGPNSQVHGEEYLKRFVPPSQWETVKAYARGDLGSRSGGLSGSMLPIIQHAMNYDPSASGLNFPARIKMQQQLSNGDPNSIGGGVRSMEQMLLHGSDLLTAAQGLNNFHSGIEAPLNYPRNMVKGMESDPTLSAFQHAVNNYAPESQKAIAGTAGGEGERRDRASSYSANMSPEAVAAGLQADARMAFQRMGAINDQYRRVMGRDITDALSPKAKAAYDAIMAGGYDKSGKPLHPAAGWTPISGGVSGPPSSSSPLGFNGGPGGGPPPTPFDNNPGGSGSMSVAQGASRNVADPRIASMTAAMINAGAGLGDINAALAKQGAEPVAPSEFTAVQSWMQQHPGRQYPAGSIDAHHTEPLSLLQRASGSALGAGAANFANSATGGIPAYLAGDQGSGAIDAMNATHGPASMIGSFAGALAGAAGGELGAANVAKSLFTNPETLDVALKYAPRISDAMQGGVQGYTGSNGNMGDAMLGAIAAPVAGKFGEKAVHGLGAAAKGVTDPAVQYLRGLDIPLTVGRTVGRSGMFGAAIKKVEDAATSLPFVGNMVEARQLDGLRGLNKAAFNIGAETTGNEVQDYGQKGVQQLAALKNQAYSRALDPVTIDANSPQFIGDVGNALSAARQIPPVEGAQDAALAALQSRIGGAVDPATGMMGGRNFQEAYRGLARTARERANKDYGYETGQVMQQGKDALTSALEDQNPGAYQAFLNANAANRRLNVLSTAVNAAKNQKDNLFSAAQLNTADANNASGLVGRIASASGDRPFAQLAQAGQEVLSSRVPDSGTATRAMIMRGVTGAGMFGSTTGAGYLAGDTGAGAETGLGTALALSVLGSKGAQKMLVKSLADRPDWLRSLGSRIQDYAPIGGVLGATGALNRLSYGSGQ